MNRYIIIYELKPEHVDDYRKCTKIATRPSLEINWKQSEILIAHR
jgi:hypothetical protein